jgi:hypothetical protein
MGQSSFNNFDILDCEKITFPEGFSELEQKNLFCTPCALLHNPRKITTLPARGKHNLYIDNKISLILRLNNPVSFYFSNEIKISRLGTQSVRDICMII